MTVQFANNASATLAGAYSDSATAVTVTAGQGAKFPTPAGGDYAIATIVDNQNNIEIVHITDRVVDTLTIVRAQEGTAARALNLGDRVEMRITKGLLEFLRDQALDTTRIADGAVTEAKLADNSVSRAKMEDAAVGTAEIEDGSVTGSKLDPDAVTDSLGHGIVALGTGAGQLDNEVSIGWSADGFLKAQVDAQDLGHILTETTTAEADSAGYRGSPTDTFNANYTAVIGDAGRTKVHSNALSHNFVVPPHAAVPFDVGTWFYVLADAGPVDVLPGPAVTVVWEGDGGIGARHIAQSGRAKVYQVSVDRWYISGSGLS